MPYRFEPGEDLPFALRRCAREQLDTAIDQLDRGENAANAIHEARKALKKERSLLRLASGSLPTGRRRRENASLRETAQTLGASRDADAIIESLDQLADRFAGQLPHSAFDALRVRLERDRDQSDARPERAAAADELRGVRERIDDWSLRSDGWAALQTGLGRAYSRGRSAIRRAERDPTAEALHEARKRSKDLWYQLRLLHAASPEIVGGHAEVAHQLTQRLGDDRDLVLLGEYLERVGPELTVDIEALASLIERRRHELQGEAFQLAAVCYAESPQAFERRMRRYWQAFETREPAAAAA